MVELSVSMFCLFICRNDNLRSAAAQIKVVRPFLSPMRVLPFPKNFGQKNFGLNFCSLKEHSTVGC